MKKIVITALLAIVTPMILNAGGVGVYVPYSLGIDAERVSTDEDTDIESTYNYTLDKRSGIGIAIGTNLGKDKVFGYKFAIEYTHPKVSYWTDEANKIEMLHTFEFSVLNTKTVKIWLGPRINLGYEEFDNEFYDRDGIEIGIAPAAGININLAEHFTIAFDIDYKESIQVGSWNQGVYSGTFITDLDGATLRLGVFYRFSE